jgi:nucleoside permease NupC
VKLAANIGGMLLVFVALIAMVNGILFELRRNYTI